jgi:hypothetical protein
MLRVNHDPQPGKLLGQFQGRSLAGIGQKKVAFVESQSTNSIAPLRSLFPWQITPSMSI